MAQTTVEIRSLADSSLAVGSAGSRTVTIDRSKDAGGFGLGFNGGELLLLAIGGCYSNDVFREADKMGIRIRSVRVEVSAECGHFPAHEEPALLADDIREFLRDTVTKPSAAVLCQQEE